MIFYMLDEITYYLLIGLSSIGGVFFILFIVFVFLIRPSKSIRTIISAWMKKLTLTSEATADGRMKLVARKRHSEGQLETKIRGQSNVKMIPQSTNPIFSTRFYLDGIPIFDSFEGSTVAFPRTATAAMRIAGMKKKDRDELPESIKAWAKEMKIPVKKFVRAQSGEKKGKVVNKTLWTVDKREAIDFFSESPGEMQYQDWLEHRYQEGRRDERKPFSAKAAGIGIGLLVLLAIVALWIMSNPGVLQF